MEEDRYIQHQELLTELIKLYPECLSLEHCMKRAETEPKINDILRRMGISCEDGHKLYKINPAIEPFCLKNPTLSMHNPDFVNAIDRESSIMLKYLLIKNAFMNLAEKAGGYGMEISLNSIRNIDEVDTTSKEEFYNILFDELKSIIRYWENHFAIGERLGLTRSEQVLYDDLQLNTEIDYDPYLVDCVKEMWTNINAKYADDEEAFVRDAKNGELAKLMEEHLQKYYIDDIDLEMSICVLVQDMFGKNIEDEQIEN